MIISLIATAAQAGANSYDYLVALQKNQESVKSNPENWLPWNYLETLTQIKATESVSGLQVVNSS